MATIQFTISNIDTEEFSAKRTILKMSLGIILVFDLGKPETFQSLKNRIGEITQNAGYIPIIMMGTNKEAEADGVRIPSMDVDQFMFKHGINHYFRVSTKTGEGIQRAFEIMSDEIIKETIRKLGPQEVKRKTGFSFAIAMIGDNCIRKDWISEFGVQRFAAPSHLGGAVSRKTMDRDIHHLIIEPRMDKIPPTPSPAPQTGGGGASVTGGFTDAQKEELKEMKFLKRGLSENKISDGKKLAEIQKDIKELSEEFIEDMAEKEMKGEVSLEKPEPLKPMEFKKSDEAAELPSDLKSAIEDEVRRVREEIADDKTPKAFKVGRTKSASVSGPPPSPSAPTSSPPSGPPSSPPKAAPKRKPAAPPPPPSFSIKDGSIDDLSSPKKKERRSKRKQKAKVMGAKLKRPAKRSAASNLSYEPEPVPIDENVTVDEDSLKDALVKATKLHPDVVEELWESGVEAATPIDVGDGAIDTDELISELKEEGFSKGEIIGSLSEVTEMVPESEKEKPEYSIPSTPVVGDRSEYEEEMPIEEDEVAEYDELPEEEGEVGYGALAVGKEMEITTEKLLRKTTVFYRERMNPETLNKLAVILSSEKIYETLKIKIDEVARAATDKGLEIDKDLPIVDVVPEFPGCVCVPSVQHIDAEKEYDVANFLITPLQSGDIPDAKVKLYHKGKLIETIPTPTKVVKTTAAKISAGVAIVVPVLSQFPLLNAPIGNFLSGIFGESLYNSLGALDGIVLILTGVIALIGGLFYLFKRPKDAKPVESFPELDEMLQGRA